MALTALPYHIAAREAGPERVFSGFISGVDDGNVYLSWVRQAAEGRTLLRNPYTTLEQSPHFFSVFLVALGRVCAWTGITPGWTASRRTSCRVLPWKPWTSGPARLS